MGMTRPVDDALFADIAPHYAERAQAELIERADFNEGANAALEAIDEVLAQLPVFDQERDKRKHGDECWQWHTDCLGAMIAGLINDGA